jgi:hypothetical protein
MSELGQKAKYSLRGDVFRFGPNNGHRAMQLASPFRANSGRRHKKEIDLDHFYWKALGIAFQTGSGSGRLK